KSAQIREILINESAWEEMTCLFAPSLDFAFALLTFITAIIVFIRYYRVFKIPQNDVRFGERYFQ
ncbi:hypothetical protein, partial [Salmonella enterica]